MTATQQLADVGCVSVYAVLVAEEAPFDGAAVRLYFDRRRDRLRSVELEAEAHGTRDALSRVGAAVQHGLLDRGEERAHLSLVRGVRAV